MCAWHTAQLLCPYQSCADRHTAMLDRRPDIIWQCQCTCDMTERPDQAKERPWRKHGSDQATQNCAPLTWMQPLLLAHRHGHTIAVRHTRNANTDGALHLVLMIAPTDLDHHHIALTKFLRLELFLPIIVLHQIVSQAVRCHRSTIDALFHAPLLSEFASSQRSIP